MTKLIMKVKKLNNKTKVCKIKSNYQIKITKFNKKNSIFKLISFNYRFNNKKMKIINKQILLNNITNS